MEFHYCTGEAVMVGDQVLVHGDRGYIEAIADPDADPQDWYVTEFGGGVMVVEPRVFGRVFIGKPDQDSSHLEFVARGPVAPCD